MSYVGLPGLEGAGTVPAGAVSMGTMDLDFELPASLLASETSSSGARPSQRPPAPLGRQSTTTSAEEEVQGDQPDGLGIRKETVATRASESVSASGEGASHELGTTKSMGSMGSIGVQEVPVEAVSGHCGGIGSDAPPLRPVTPDFGGHCSNPSRIAASESCPKGSGAGDEPSSISAPAPVGFANESYDPYGGTMEEIGNDERAVTLPVSLGLGFEESVPIDEAIVAAHQKLPSRTAIADLPDIPRLPDNAAADSCRQNLQSPIVHGCDQRANGPPSDALDEHPPSSARNENEEETLSAPRLSASSALGSIDARNPTDSIVEESLNFGVPDQAPSRYLTEQASATVADAAIPEQTAPAIGCSRDASQADDSPRVARQASATVTTAEESLDFGDPDQAPPRFMTDESSGTAVATMLHESKKRNAGSRTAAARECEPADSAAHNVSADVRSVRMVRNPTTSTVEESLDFGDPDQTAPRFMSDTSALSSTTSTRLARRSTSEVSRSGAPEQASQKAALSVPESVLRRSLVGLLSELASGDPHGVLKIPRFRRRVDDGVYTTLWSFTADLEEACRAALDSNVALSRTGISARVLRRTVQKLQGIVKATELSICERLKGVNAPRSMYDERQVESKCPSCDMRGTIIDIQRHFERGQCVHNTEVRKDPAQQRSPPESSAAFARSGSSHGTSPGAATRLRVHSPLGGAIQDAAGARLPVHEVSVGRHAEERGNISSPLPADNSLPSDFATQSSLCFEDGPFRERAESPIREAATTSATVHADPPRFGDRAMLPSQPTASVDEHDVGEVATPSIKHVDDLVVEQMERSKIDNGAATPEPARDRDEGGATSSDGSSSSHRNTRDSSGGRHSRKSRRSGLSRRERGIDFLRRRGRHHHRHREEDGERSHRHRSTDKKHRRKRRRKRSHSSSKRARRSSSRSRSRAARRSRSASISCSTVGTTDDFPHGFSLHSEDLGITASSPKALGSPAPPRRTDRPPDNVLDFDAAPTPRAGDCTVLSSNGVGVHQRRTRHAQPAKRVGAARSPTGPSREGQWLQKKVMPDPKKPRSPMQPVEWNPSSQQARITAFFNKGHVSDGVDR